MPGWLMRQFWYVSLGNHEFRFLFDEPPDDEVVSLDCETTGLDPRVDDIITIAAVKVKGDRILTSEKFEVVINPDKRPTADSIRIHQLRVQDVEAGERIMRVIPDLLRFIGARPILGYYIDFDMRMLDKYVLPLIQTKLPNKRIEVSGLFHDLRYRNAAPGTPLDLRFNTILAELGIPPLPQHDALNDAVMSAEIWLQLRDLAARGVRLSRPQDWRSQPHPFGG